MPAPRYDVTLLAPCILGAPAIDVDAGPEGEGPGAAGEAGQERLDRRVFWGVLAGAVVVLLAVLARLVRMGEGTGAA